MLGKTLIGALFALALIAPLQASEQGCEEPPSRPVLDPCCEPSDGPSEWSPALDPNPFMAGLRKRIGRYAELGRKHKLAGLASYYSSSLDGLPTANGETFRNSKLTAAHLTLPLGTWVEIESRGTGKKLRCRVNDRGPYAKKFMLDLSQAAARRLGVDVAPDRYVRVRVIALPGEEPLPEDWELAFPPEEEAEPAPSVIPNRRSRGGGVVGVSGGAR